MPPTAKAAIEAESELGRAAELIGEIVNGRKAGDFEGVHGNDDEDLLAAVEEFERAARAWRRTPLIEE